MKTVTNRFVLHPLTVAIFANSLFAVSAVQAQGSLVLEEVTVTAQFREESLQSVPVSVSAVSGDKLLEAGIDKIEDLQAYVPNLSMSETGIGTNIYVRGLGSGINQGFEQSVGIYVDGVYYGRAQLSRAPFLDLSRVEVLRGPQNILYGKNSIAGALSVVTAKPTEEFEGSVSALYEPDHGEQVFDLVLSGPIAEGLSGRLAYRTREVDGYLENALLNEDEPGRDEETLRLTLAWDVSEDLDVTFKYKTGEFDVTGRQIEIVGDSPSLNPALGGANWSQFLTLFGADTSVLNTSLDGVRTSNGDFSNNETENFTLTVNYQRDDYLFTSITGLLSYEFEERCDCDFTAANIFFVDSEEDYEQFSQEFRITSPAGGAFEWVGGFYYQDSELDFNDDFYAQTASVLPFILETVLPVAFANPAPPPATLFPAGAALATIPGLSVPRTFEQDTEVWSLFFQGTFNIAEDLRFTFGGRYTDEDKEGSRRLTYADLAGNELPFNDLFIPATMMGVDYLLGTVFKVVRHDLSGERDETKFSPMISVEYDVNEDVMTYLTWSRGFKSGGYDARSNSAPGLTILNTAVFPTPVASGTFEYEDEEAETIELGMKASLADGAAELNAAWFYTEYDDLQISIYDGVLGFNVGNAAKAEVQGLELDGRWKVTEYLVLSGSLAFTDFEFDEFPNGQCTQLQRIATNTIQCDYSGLSNQYVADWTGSLIADFNYPVGDGLELRASVDLNYTDDYNPSQNLDPMIEQDGYTKVNARLALVATDGVWEVALVGKNLTDEEIITYANDTPLSANLAQSIGYYAFTERERTVAIQGAYRF